jgi:MYXO-CTERM domain-containing protein
MRIIRNFLLAATLLLFVAGAQAATGIWRDVTPAQPGARSVETDRLFQADDQALRSALADTPLAISGRLDHHLVIPMPDGELASFSVQEAPVLAPELAAKYPGIRTFRVFAVDDERVSGRIDITPVGFHGMIRTRDGRVFIDPDNPGSQDHVYRVRFAHSEPHQGFNCGVESHAHGATVLPAVGRRFGARTRGNLMRYQLAVAVTNEYYQSPGLNDDTITTAAIATTVNRVNFVYERDLGITFELVADNELLYESVDNGELDNEDELALLAEVDDWIDNRLPNGDADYDIGHMFSRPGVFNSGGVAFIGAVCDNSIKAGGVSGMSDPTGDAFNIDLVAHEIGHQFGAEHTFNGTVALNCQSNRNPSTAFEPGSGSSIMSYSGICAGENLQTSGVDVSFHSGSIEQINSYTAGTGGTCDALVVIGNVDPTVDTIDDLTIPASTTIPANTPFLLGATASDADPDTLEYRWDQLDAGCPTDATNFGTDIGSNALFRGYEPRPEAWRNFPALGTQVQGRYDKAEVLPCHSRALNFRLTVTDGNSGQDFENVLVNVTDAAGPFEITNLDPDPGIVSGTPFQVDWDPAGTDTAPISCGNVDIDLLAFNPTYSRYTVYALGTAANAGGSAMVTVTPDTASHPRSRIRVKCSDNIFYDISDTDLNITAGMGPGVPLNDSVAVARVFANIAITDTTAPSCPAIVNCSSPPPTNGGSSGSRDATSFDHLWLLLLAGIAVLGRLRRRQGAQ